MLRACHSALRTPRAPCGLCAPRPTRPRPPLPTQSQYDALGRPDLSHPGVASSYILNNNLRKLGIDRSLNTSGK